MDVDIIFGSFSRALFEAAGQLRWVQTEGAGIDNLLFSEFVESPIILTSAKGTVGSHLADHTWALLLGLLRGVGRAVRERTWDNRMSIRRESWELGGATLGIVGLGGVGIEVARRAGGFGMEVIAVDPEPVEKPDFVREIWDTDRFYDLLEQSDVVSVCCPLTQRTRGLFDREAFRHMKPGYAPGERDARPHHRRGCAAGGVGPGPHLRGRAGRDFAGAAAGRQPAMGPSPRNHHASRFRRLSAAVGPYHRPVLREPAPLLRGARVTERDRQAEGVLRV